MHPSPLVTLRDFHVSALLCHHRSHRRPPPGANPSPSSSRRANHHLSSAESETAVSFSLSLTRVTQPPGCFEGETNGNNEKQTTSCTQDRKNQQDIFHHAVQELPSTLRVASWKVLRLRLAFYGTTMTMTTLIEDGSKNVLGIWPCGHE